MLFQIVMYITAFWVTVANYRFRFPFCDNGNEKIFYFPLSQVPVCFVFH